MGRAEVEHIQVGQHTSRRPVWAGVAIRYDDGTICAYQIDEPTDGYVEFSREYDEPPGLLQPPSLRDYQVEIAVRGRSMVHWRQGAEHAAAEEEKRRTVKADCPKCGAVSQTVELDANYDVDGLFDPLGRRWRPALRGFEMGCRCYVPANGWTLQVQVDPPRAWFEANR